MRLCFHEIRCKILHVDTAIDTARSFIPEIVALLEQCAHILRLLIQRWLGRDHPRVLLMQRRILHHLRTTIKRLNTPTLYAAQGWFDGENTCIVFKSVWQQAGGAVISEIRGADERESDLPLGDEFRRSGEVVVGRRRVPRVAEQRARHHVTRRRRWLLRSSRPVERRC